jgi:hypothetical protein
VAQTVIFENKYKVDINKFSTTHQVTAFLEKKLNKSLETVSLRQNMVSNRGNIFPVTQIDINKKLDKALNFNK